MSEQKEVKGYKVFNSDWTCRDFQYKVGKSYEIEEEPIACKRGFHFCRKLIDCYDYYAFSPKNKVAEVTAYGEIDTKENKQCTNKIRIEREISWHEVLNTVNTGKYCTGIENSGDYNCGNWNNGNRNSGYINTGCYNSGDYNAGDRNSGNYNKGHHNSGDFNTGSYNSGDFNSSDFNSGCFNTKPTKMYMFNKLSDWTMKDWLNSETKNILEYYVLVNPTTLKELSYTEIEKIQQEKWNCLPQEEKEIVMSIPNFDKAIFKEMTGIDVDRER